MIAYLKTFKIKRHFGTKSVSYETLLVGGGLILVTTAVIWTPS